MPQISVVIPAYNAERTIVKTIESVQQQTFKDFELIVINDGSCDRTLELLQSIEDKRLKIFSYNNGGLPTARNRGLSHATGEFITFIDADDLWTADKLEAQLAALQQHPKAGVAYSWTYFMYEKGDFAFHPCPPTLFEGNVYGKLLVSDFIHSGSNVLLRKQALESVGGFDPALKSCEDWDCWLRLAAKWTFVVVPKYQILYRQASGSMSSKIETMKSAALMALEKAYRAAPPELQHLKKQTFVSFHKYVADLYLQHSTDSNAVTLAGQNLWAAIRLQPQTLLTQTTQRTLIKFILKRVFPAPTASYFLKLLSKTRTSPDPRFKDGRLVNVTK